jgi:DNA polymerase-3 subunit epsilon
VIDKPVIIYNVPFDRRMVRQTCDFYNLRYPRCKEFYCAMQWYSQWYGWKKKKDGSYRWKKLPEGDHSAIGDCLAVLKLIRKMAGYNLDKEAQIIPLAR